MTYDRRVVSPRIVPPPRYGLRAFVVLLLLVATGFVAVAAFYVGIQYERLAAAPLTERIISIEQERQALVAQVLELKQRTIVLERSQQIDREANRTASKQLKDAQDERLALDKEVSFLRRLFQEGGGGILRPKDFKLKETEEPGEFGYSFTVQQLIPDFGESAGDVDVKVVGKRDDKETTLSLAKLEGANPKSHKMKFKHFQSVEGVFRLPDDFEPENLVVEIKPTTVKLIPVSETFPWSVQ